MRPYNCNIFLVFWVLAGFIYFKYQKVYLISIWSQENHFSLQNVKGCKEFWPLLENKDGLHFQHLVACIPESINMFYVIFFCILYFFVEKTKAFCISSIRWSAFQNPSIQQERMHWELIIDTKGKCEMHETRAKNCRCFVQNPLERNLAHTVML